MKLVNQKQMNFIDRSAVERFHIPSLILMEHAAYGICLEMQKILNRDDRILIVCGSGNNGGDGFALARLLFIEGYDVCLYMLGDVNKCSEDTRINYEACVSLGITFVEDIVPCSVLVDALFGTGLSRSLEGRYEQCINKINALDAKIISVDIPSGISCDDGHMMGCAVKADITYTMQCGKPGLYIYPGRLYSGKVIVVDIFIPKVLVEECESSCYLVDKDVMRKMLPKRSMHSHKGSYGKVLCIGGSLGMNGAISMAAKSAMRCGCGMITCAVPECIAQSVSTMVLESMSIVLPDNDGHISSDAISVLEKRINQYDVVLIGCGIGRSEDIKKVVELVLKQDMPLIIDADALYAYREVMHFYKDRNNIIITPHMKEFAALYNKDIQDVVLNSRKLALSFGKEYPNITLVLKSETTLVVQGEEMYINTYGNNGLAKGGSGDVLAGMIAGMLAQNKNVLEAGVLGVFLHAYCADEIVKKKSEYTLCPTDLIEELDDVLNDLRGDNS